jgi:peptidoglycan biosynthesis protein MviN/MurJ (putative lipid II flippase)
VSKPQKTLGDRIVRAGFAVLAAHICLKLCGLFQQQIIPNHYGAAVSDVFATVYSTVLATAFSIGEQCLAPAFLPVFVAAREKDGEARAWRYASIIFNLQFILLALTIAVLMLFSKPIIGLLTEWSPKPRTVATAAGPLTGEIISLDATVLVIKVDGVERRVPRAEVLSPEKDLAEWAADAAQRAERRTLAERMMAYMAPGLLGMSLASLTYVVLNAHKEFFFAAFGDSILKLAVLLGALAGLAAGKISGHLDWRYIAAGAVAGGTAKFGTHVFALGRRLKQYQFSLNLRDEHARNFFLLVLPLMAGILISSGRDLVINKALTVQELLPTCYRQGKSLIDTISFLVPYTLSIALLPFFCDLTARGDIRQLGAVLTRTLRMLLWFFIPVSVILAAAAPAMCFVLYSGKVIDAEKTRYSALVMQCFALQLPFAALEIMVMQGFFSSRRMIAPTLAGLVFSISAAALAYTLVIRNGMSDPFHILLAVSGCVVGAKILKSLALLGMLRWTVPVLPASEAALFLPKLLMAGGAAAAAAWGAAALCHGPLAAPLSRALNARALRIGEALLLALAGATAHLAVSLLLRMDEPREFWHWTREKLKGRAKE